MPLTPKQAKFVAAYVAEPNATRAAIAAGYSEKAAGSIGFENMQKPDIQQAIAQAHATALQRVQKAQDEAVGTAEWIIRNAAETHREARADGQFGPAVAALNLLSKRLPEFRDNTPQAPNQTLVLNGLSDDQLEAVISRLAGGSA